MKKLMFVFGVAGVVTLSTPSLMNAQTAGKSAAVSQREEIEAQVERDLLEISKDLNLNEQQKSVFKKLDTDRLYKIYPIKEKIKTTTDENEKQKLIAEREKINDEYIKNFNSYLTPAQQEIFKKKIEEMRAKSNAKSQKN
jgi:hypothetical protein